MDTENNWPIPEERRYCEYCYEDQVLEMNEDGSLISCTMCGSGLAPFDDAVAAGGYDAFVERREILFRERHM